MSACQLMRNDMCLLHKELWVFISGLFWDLVFKVLKIFIFIRECNFIKKKTKMSQIYLLSKITQTNCKCSVWVCLPRSFIKIEETSFSAIFPSNVLQNFFWGLGVEIGVHIIWYLWKSFLCVGVTVIFFWLNMWVRDT